MSIGTKVKKLRRERDMTQEQLADYLGISAKAVSQWETDRTAPDISQIPVLCNIFDITSDELLGIDVKNNEKRIDEIIAGLRKIAASGEHKIAIDKAREGLSGYPNSFKLMLFFAEEIYLYSHMTPENERDANKDTALSYLEQILENCTDTSIRNRAHTTLCLWYAELGHTEEAETLAKEKESSFTSGELLARIYKGTKRFEVLRTEVQGQFFHAVAYNFAGLIKSKYDDGTPVYSDDEKLAMHQMAIDMIKMFIPDKDYCFLAQFIENSGVTFLADIGRVSQNKVKFFPLF